MAFLHSYNEQGIIFFNKLLIFKYAYVHDLVADPDTINFSILSMGQINYT